MMRYVRLAAVLAVVGMVLIAMSQAMAYPLRDYGGWYTQERIANLRANCEKFEWAAAQRDAAVAAAAKYMELDDDYLWKLIPGQDLPRAIDVSMNRINGVQYRPGCPVCGHDIDKFGNYPYNPDIIGMPWKLKCPSCNTVFPTNDFGAYYESGINDAGVFDPKIADRSLLYNTEHPDPNDPLHTYGVDDGFGFFDKDGDRYLFIAYYNWKQWTFIRGMIATFCSAYVYTGDKAYARKALIMLDRIADVYPDYDIRPYQKLAYYHSGGGNGKVEGNIWECGVVTNFGTCVDEILSGTIDNPELYEFLARKAEQYDIGEKGTRELLIQNLDDGILREGAKAVMEKAAAGNQGMHQRAILACAMALNQNPETEQWIDWIFAENGGTIPGVIMGGIDRDGVGAEAAPGYALGWGSNIGIVADWLADYDGYTKNDIYRDFPSFAATFTAGWNIGVLGYDAPNIGDTGSVGSLGLVAASPSFIARGYKYLKDPAIGLAAYYANDRDAGTMGRDIYSADPDGVARGIAEAAASTTDNPFEGGHNMAGYGLASLEYGWGKPGAALWMYYGRNAGHGHQDRLNWGMLYRGLDISPDLGYPEYASNWPKRTYSNRNTLSHNCVLVNQIQQSTNWVGHPEFFTRMDDFGAFRVDSAEVYADVDKYQRTLAMVPLAPGEFYAVDVFRVRGGNDHVYAFHGPPGEVTAAGLDLTKQEGGSYFGPDVPFKTETAKGEKFGYSWFANVERDNAPADSFSVDWRISEPWLGAQPENDIHLRFHNLTPLADVALADVEPPQNKPGNPAWLRYVLAHRTGDEGLVSTFAGVIEPYAQNPNIASVERLEITDQPDGAEAVAVRITLADGAVDYVLASDDDTGIVTVAGGIEFACGAGWMRTRGGVVEKAAMTRGTLLAMGSFSLEAEAPGHTGTIAQMDKDAQGDGYIWVDTPLPTDDTLVGRQIIINNDRVRNACYTIAGIEQDGDRWKVNCGRVSFIRGYVDGADYSKGYLYNFDEGAEFIIPNAVSTSSNSGQVAWKLTTTMPVTLSVPDAN